MLIADVLGNLAHHTSLLFTLTLGYSAITLRLSGNKRFIGAVQGFLFGLFSVFSMLGPHSGIVTDVRGIIIAISGAQNGYLSAIMTGIVVSLYRLIFGGSEPLPSVLGIWFYVFLGCVFRFSHPRSTHEFAYKQYLMLGLTHAILMGISMAFLPPPIREMTISRVLLPGFIIFPATAVGVTFLIFQLRHYHETVQALAHDRELLQILINRVPDLDSIKDQDLKPIFHNVSYAEGARIPFHNQVIEESIGSLPDSQEWQEDLRAISGDTISGCERIFVNTAGNLIYASVNKMPIRDAEGNIAGLINIGHNTNSGNQSLM
jgi:hypothetical protein